ncbi:MAG: molybdopterin-dependent oxidoreductase [Thermodesulfobacteriota bacterium]
MDVKRDEKEITMSCSGHCGGRCIVKVHVSDGVIRRIEANDGGDPQLRPCLRGRAYRQRVYSPDRLKFPMKRVGARGEGKFERITWDEALDTVARELKRVKATYGPAAILMMTGGGDSSSLSTGTFVNTLVWKMGGTTKTWGTLSNEGGGFAAQITYGTTRVRSTFDDLTNSRLIIIWGWNPANTVCGHASWYLAQAKEKGIKIVSIDPRCTDTTAIFANRWIPIIPGTDTAMLISMAYVMIKGKLQDQAFLDRYTVGFEPFKDYVEGKEDGIPKTPAWAEPITGVPAATIEKLARDYATTKPAALLCGISPGRTAYGEQYHRAAITLSAMTGNIGIPGGSSAGMVWAITMGGYPFLKMPRIGRGMGVGDVANPVEVGAPPRKYAPLNYGQHASSARIHFSKVADAILKGRAGGYPSDYKLLYVVGSAYPNQYCNINKAVKALKQLEFIAVHEQFMTPTAKFADILLPANSLYERNDVTTGHVTPPFYGYMHKVVESLDESKSHYEIAMELAPRIGVSDFVNKREDEMLMELIKKSDIPDLDAFKKEGFYKVTLPEPHVAFKKQIEDPINHPFPTPSGKIEIYSQHLAQMNHPELPPIPKYIETWESRNDPLARKYPLQLITTHFLRRAHTQFDNLPWLREIRTQAISMNPVDAKVRNVRDGDQVRVFNDRGKMILPVRITERITPGVVDIPQGAWFNPDEKGIDRGGSANVLTRDESSPGGALTSNTTLVQVERAES